MLSRYSVKKPYTVVVAVVLILILGGVSFTKMNTDLFPSMNLPYAIVMTTYPGASPETVEEVVTKPVEQSMATVSNIKNVSSSSNDNMSMVILEFEDTANMDSVTIEMREKLDQIGSYWDDVIGKPIIMKLNPDMMPIMVAAVDLGNMDSTQVTDYVEKNVSSEVESVAGVASVSTMGNVSQRVDVIIRQDKIDAMNEKVRRAVDSSFAKKEGELTDAQEEIDSGKEELESGKEQLEQGKQEAAEKLAEGQAQLNNAQSELTQNATKISVLLQMMDMVNGKEGEINAAIASLDEAEAQIKEGMASLKEALDGLVTLTAADAALGEQEASVQTALGEMQKQLETLKNQTEQNPEIIKQMAALEEQIKTMTAGITDIQGKRAELQAQTDALVSSIGQMAAEQGIQNPQQAQAYLENQLSVMEASLSGLTSSKSAMQEGLAQLAEQRAQLSQAKEQIDAGQMQVSEAIAQLNTQSVLASIDMSVAQAKIDMGSAQLEQVQTQLDAGKEQLDDAKEQVQNQTDLYDILTADMIKGVLTAENFSMPAGYVTEDGIDYLVRVGDKVENPDTLENLVILDMGLDDMYPIHLSDVAEVAVTDNSSDVYAKLNGNPGIMLTIEKQTGFSTGDVTDRLLERFSQMEEENPDFHATVLMNQGIYIDMVVNSVLQNLLMGAALAILILFIFLKDIRPTFVIACSIPISVVTAIVLMYFSGITLNVISLSGLALGVGMLVDNSIVVIENIYRMGNEGIPPRKAAIEGAKQVAGAISASTLTTICVFAPIVFTEGITKQLFVDMGLTIAFSLLASLAVALTLVPMMSAGMLKKAKPKPSKLLDRVRNFYGALIEIALKYKAVVLILAVALFAFSMKLCLSKGTSFMPAMESTQATLTISTEKGTLFEETTQRADEVIASIEDIEDIETIGAMAGGSGMSMTGESSDNQVSMYLVLKEEKELSGEELEKEILKRTKDIDCEVFVETSSMDMSALGGSGINVQIKGKELDTLQSIAKDVKGIVEKAEGTANVSDGMEEASTEYRVVVDKSKAMAHKLTVAQVYKEINARLAEANSATTISTATKDYKVYVKSEQDESLTREDIQDLTIKVTNSEQEEEEIRIGDIAVFEEAESPQSINRDAQSRYMSVTAEIDADHNIGLVSSAIEKELEKYDAPEGYTIEMKGEDESINEAMGQLILMLVLALVFMYLIMVAQFQSLLSPFIIMFTIPLAFTGGFFGLVIAGQELSIIAMIGFVMLSGIIVNNGIVLVDYINQLRKDGMEKRQAIAEAGKSRLRPIVMTALTTVLGLSTMAMGVGMGGDMVQPMAIVTIGGLLYGTLLTLFVVPCIYDILNRKKFKKDEARLQDEESEQPITDKK